jgi:hypothetical protein
VQPGAVGQSRVNVGVRVVQALARRGGQSARQALHGGVVGEANAGRFPSVAPVHPDVIRRIDHDIGG